MQAKTFEEILKYNPNHDSLGRFASSPGAGGGGSASNPSKYKELYPQDSYQNTAEFQKYQKAFNEKRHKKDEIGDKIKSLEKELEKESTPKPRDQWDDSDEASAIMGDRPLILTERGEQIKEELKQARKERRETDTEMWDIYRKKEEIVTENSKKQHKTFDKPTPATQEEYVGFTTKEQGTSFGNDFLNGTHSRDKKAYIAEMSPKEYLERCAYEIFESTMESTLNGVEKEKIDRYTKMMAEGTDFHIPYLDYSSHMQEGRHRAAAAYNNGIDKIPVLIIEDVEAKKSLAKGEKPTGCGVIVVKDGEILTGTRIERDGAGRLCGPGGHIDPGETPEEAAKREAYEEFGIMCHELEYLGMQDGGDRFGTAAVFLCTDFAGTPKTDEREMTAPTWRTIAEIRDSRVFPPFLDSLKLLTKETSEIAKYNHNHDALGRFTFSHGAGAGSGGGGGARGHLGFMKNQEAVAHTMKECGVSEEKAKDMVKAISGYTEGYAYEMRNYQQTGKTSEMTPSEAEEMSRNVEDFIEKSPKWDGGEIYRGISLKEEGVRKLLMAQEMNQSIDMKGTSSWSSDKETAEDFGAMTASSSDMTVIFKAPGTKKGTSVDHLSEFSQAEVLVSKDARWRIKDIDGSFGQGYFEVKVEELP